MSWVAAVLGLFLKFFYSVQGLLCCRGGTVYGNAAGRYVYMYISTEYCIKKK